MDLGLAIGVFILVAFVLATLFCIVTRYFNYRLRKALIQQNEIYSLIEGIEGDREDINEGEYQDFVQKRIADKKQRELEKQKNYQLMIEMTEMKQPLKDTDENIYGISRLKRRLDKNVQSSMPPSVRSLISPKSFKPEKLSNFSESQRSKESNEHSPLVGKKNSVQITSHKIVQKIVCYTEEGIKIIQCKAKELWKEAENGEIKENRKVVSTVLTSQELGFDQTLEAYGFEKQIYEAYKFTSTYEIVGMRPHEKYSTKSLKRTQQKEQMEFPSFYIYKDHLETTAGRG